MPENRSLGELLKIVRSVVNVPQRSRFLYEPLCLSLLSVWVWKHWLSICYLLHVGKGWFEFSSGRLPAETANQSNNSDRSARPVWAWWCGVQMETVLSERHRNHQENSRDHDWRKAETLLTGQDCPCGEARRQQRRADWGGRRVGHSSEIVLIKSWSRVARVHLTKRRWPRTHSPDEAGAG